MTKRNVLLALVVVFGLGALVGLRTSPAQAGLGTCYWRCICSVPYKCCTTPMGTTCKPDPNGPVQCPQYGC